MNKYICKLTLELCVQHNTYEHPERYHFGREFWKNQGVTGVVFPLLKIGVLTSSFTFIPNTLIGMKSNNKYSSRVEGGETRNM